MLFGQNKMPWRGSPVDTFRDAFMGGTGTPMMMRQDIFLPESKWPKDCSPLTVAILSDLHIGCPAMSLERVESIVDRTNAEMPDLILLVGDYTNKERLNGPYVEPDIFAKILGRLRARYGVFAVCGNHDNYDDREGVRRALLANGIPVIENDAVKIRRRDRDLWLLGFPDELTDKVDVKKAFDKVTSPDPIIAMAHNPATFMKMDPRVALTMSGHNHGGQCRLPGVGAIYLPHLTPLRYAYGHIQENGGDLFVGPGLGTSDLPLRVFCPAGVPLLKLQAQ